MKFVDLLLTIFKNLMNTDKFKVPQNVRGRPIVTEFVNIFKNIIFKIKSGVKWEDVACYGEYSTSTVYKYFKFWCKNGMFNRVYKKSLRVYSSRKRISWKYQAIDATIVKAYRGGEVLGKNRLDKGRKGSKIHTLVDQNGIPLSFMVTGANYHESRSVPSLLGKYKIRRPIYRQHMNLDTGYDSRAIRECLSENLFVHHIPRNKRNGSEDPPQMSDEEIQQHYRHRLTVEHHFGHLKQYKSILMRYTRKINHYINMINIANACIICKKI